MLCLIEKEIEGVQVELNVDETSPDNVLDGQPFITVGRKTNMVFAVDCLTIIKAIAVSESLTDLADNITNVYNENSIKKSIIIAGVGN